MDGHCPPWPTMARQTGHGNSWLEYSSNHNCPLSAGMPYRKGSAILRGQIALAGSNGAFQLKGLSECAAACVVVTALALGYILGSRSFGLSFSLELDVVSTK